MAITKYIVVYASFDDENIKSEDEYKAIKQWIEPADHFEIWEHIKGNSGKKLHTQLLAVIKRYPNHKIIMQLAGHSDRASLHLPKDDGKDSELLKIIPSDVKKYIETFDNKIECIIFSSCSSLNLAKTAFEIPTIKCCIATTLDIEHETTISFVSLFYQILKEDHDDFQKAAQLAKNGHILSKEDHFFWHKTREIKIKPPSQFDNIFSNAINNEEMLKSCIDLENLFQDIKNNTTTKDINKDIYNNIQNIIIDINKIVKNFPMKPSELTICDDITTTDKINIFLLQQRLLFEYPIAITDKISSLIDMQSSKINEHISKIIDKLIEEYEDNMSKKIDKLINPKDLMEIVNKRKILKKCFEDERNIKVKRAEMYETIYRLMKLLLDDSKLLEINNAKRKLRNEQEVKPLLDNLTTIKNTLEEYQNSVTDYIPEHLL